MLQSLDRAFYQRLAVTAAVLAAYRVGCHLPVPGLASDTVAGLIGPGGAAVARLSIFALGIMPLLSVLIFAELLKTIAPDIRRWEHASPRNRDRFRYALVGLALLVAAVQGAGVAGALEDVSGLVLEPGSYFRLVCTATLVAGAALVIALAGVIDRAGLGSGLWLLFLAPALAELAPNLAAIADAYDRGTYPLLSVVLGALFTAFTVAAVAGIVLAARGSEAVSAACVWPLLIAYALMAWLLVGLGLSLTGGDVDAAMNVVAPGSLARLMTLAVVVVLVTWLYARAYRASQPLSLPAAPIAAAMAAIALAAEILTFRFATLLPLDSVQLVVVAVVATRMLLAWKLVGADARPAEAAT